MIDEDGAVSVRHLFFAAPKTAAVIPDPWRASTPRRSLHAARQPRDPL
ncbi:hypothetical protein ACFONL_11885 [Camelimonas fluminis]|uniref:Uncharacterized protein n=1 Tax=Camelimonas fluminis TaxID=1576911 RepID=A0ABV7UHR1_9HYPH|nr:hypothetical protein [Camelimonas fluminis]